MTQQPTDPGLYLKVVSDETWEEECNDNWHIFPPDSKGGKLLRVMRQECATCHGKGTRRVRLGGMVTNVVFDPVAGPYVPGLQAWIMVNGVQCCGTGVVFCEPFSSNPIEAFPVHRVVEVLMENIASVYRAGTLPADLMATDDRPWRLRVEEVEDDSTV